METRAMGAGRAAAGSLWRAVGAACWLALAAAAPGEDRALLVDDFEDRDLVAVPGVSWIPICDELLGGSSRGGLEIVAGAGGSRGALAFSGEVVASPRGSLASVWTTVGPQGSPLDLSAYSGMRLRARGTPGTYSAGVRLHGQNVNFMAPLTLEAEWKSFELPFAEFRPQPAQDAAWSPGAVAWVGIATASAPGGGWFRIEVDDLAFVPGAPGAVPKPAAAAGSGYSKVSRTRLADAGPLASLAWRALASDPAGDGTSPRLPDAATLAWAADGEDRVWFRVGLHGPPPERWLGINVALDVDGDPVNGMAWWGANKAFHFDRLITAYLWHGADHSEGILGVTGADAVGRMVMDELGGDVRVAVDRASPALLVGVPRALIGARAPRLIATVGSAMINNDDLPNEGAAEARLAAAAAAGD